MALNIVMGVVLMSASCVGAPVGASKTCTSDGTSKVEEAVIRFRSVSGPGPAIGRVVLSSDLGPNWSNADAAHALTLDMPASGRTTAVLVPDPVGIGAGGARGATVFITAGVSAAGDVRATLGRHQEPIRISGDFQARLASATLVFAARASGGFPIRVKFAGSETAFDRFAWNDRVHGASRGSWMLRYDPNPDMRVLWSSAELTVVRAHARYCDAQGRQAPGNARATYDWYIPAGHHQAFVQSFAQQDHPTAWDELHHLELNFPDARFTQWAGGAPDQAGDFRADKRGWMTPSWGCLVAGREAIGIIGQPVLFYDGRGDYGTYIHGSWSKWASEHRRLSAWIWIGSEVNPVATIRAAAERPNAAVMALTTPALRADIGRRQANPSTRTIASVAERLEMEGDLRSAARLVRTVGTSRSALPDGWTMDRAGDLALTLQRTSDGVVVRSLYDIARSVELAAHGQPPLFRLTLKHASEGECAITADHGWTSIKAESAKVGLTLRWSKHSDPRAAGVSVTAMARRDPKRSAYLWSIKVECAASRCAVQSVAFPQISIEPPGPDARVIYPTGPGVESLLQANTSIDRRSLYPNGWCTMQLMAVYSRASRTGLYYACHDPYAASKHIVQRREAGDPGVLLAFDVPAPDMHRAGTPFTWPGVAVWQRLSGDWFDAARIYRDWVTREAHWWPKLSRSGRADTPEWMRNLSAWAQTGGAPADCVEQVKRMQRALGVPIGFHWYNWHEIPFDNDYPHYFPTKPGVAAAVADLQANGVYVMPYINGRLWDTRDRGGEDFEFTSRALPAATKTADGKPFTETYGSKETDGSPVRLAVMCPTTDLWRSTIRDTVLRIMNEVGARGVYIDQIAAAAPVLCMDPTHGHPLGGGHWWTKDGYWPFLDAIQSSIPRDCMITTECAAEPYANRIDGYLTWDWQGDGMVPMLPAVYGGAVQYFGRNYAAGATTRDNALCMKMGQQLVFGEQIGWCSPALADEPIAGAFLRRVVHARHANVRFFNAGEMARPPSVSGEIPSVRADWAWYGETWVTTSALLTGAWSRLQDRELLLVFANVSDTPVVGQFTWNATSYGIPARAKATCSVTRYGEAPDSTETGQIPARTTRRLSLPPRSVETWLIRWQLHIP